MRVDAYTENLIWGYLKPWDPIGENLSSISKITEDKKQFKIKNIEHD